MARLIDADDLIRHAKETKITAIFPNYTEFSSETGNAIGMYGQYWKTLLEDAPTIEPKQEWISVRDRLPEKGKSVLVYWDDGFDIGEYVGGEVGDDVYWMPLPEPPKEGE